MESQDGEEVVAFFVYGTLKQRGANAHVWPRRALRIKPAIVQAVLFDLGPYPAIDRGDDWVLGELWMFALQDVPATLLSLDALEGYQQAGNADEYRREIVQAIDADHNSVPAYAYFYQDRSYLTANRRLPSAIPWQGRRCACWPNDPQ